MNTEDYIEKLVWDPYAGDYVTVRVPKGPTLEQVLRQERASEEGR